jgi:hypothetical protein
VLAAIIEEPQALCSRLVSRRELDERELDERRQTKLHIVALTTGCLGDTVSGELQTAERNE